MKKKHLFTAICMATCLLSCSSNSDDFSNKSTLSNTFNSDVTDKNGLSVYMEEADASNQYLANVLYTEILQAIGQKTKGDPTKVLYPDYYGGAFTTNEGRLTVLIKGNMEEGRKRIRSAIHDDNIVNFKECKYSYQELIDILNHISDLYPNFPRKLQENISAFYISDADNIIVIGLECLNQEVISEIKKFIIDDQAVIFKSMHRKQENNSIPLKTIVPIHFYVQPGFFLSNRSGIEYSGSWAFRARSLEDSTVIGMVTASHVLTTDSVFNQNVLVGLCSYQLYTDTIDAAFVELEHNLFMFFEGSNDLSTIYVNGDYPNANQEQGTLSIETNSPVVGTPVNKRGWTTGRTFGYVMSTNFHSTFIDHYGLYRSIANMEWASFDCDEGDSGGIVYTYYSNLNKRYTTGIISGTVMNNLNVVMGGFYTKANLAIERLGIERY